MTACNLHVVTFEDIETIEHDTLETVTDELDPADFDITTIYVVRAAGRSRARPEPLDRESFDDVTGGITHATR